jgi:DNA adenine methylase
MFFAQVIIFQSLARINFIAFCGDAGTIHAESELIYRRNSPMLIRPPVKWHGGKRYLARQIIEHFPGHRIYLEPFGGGASVLLNKKPVEVEVYNDIDQRITRLFRVLRDQGDLFLEKARLTLYSQVEFEDAVDYPSEATDLEMALCDFIRWRQSFGGKGQSWSYTTGRARGGMAGDVNAWWTAIEHLPEIINRIRRVQILCQSAFDAIPRFDHPEGLIYCDPPYVHSTREKNSRLVYHAEMSDDDHRKLGTLLRKCNAKVVLSGYPSDLYEEIYAGWRVVSFDIANHASGGKQKNREIECLWMNF